MREELKQREAELEKSFEDKQQLKSQVQTLKEGLQNLQNTHVMQVSLTGDTLVYAGFPENVEKGRVYHVSLVYFKGKFISELLSLCESEHYLICTLIRKKLVQDEFQRIEDIVEINHQ